MSIQKVRAYFAQFDMAQRILEFPVSSATVELAAQALGCEGKRIVKTLAFQGPSGPVLIATAGDAKVDNAKYKAYFGGKAKMLSHDDAATLIGHAVGGVCPFALPENVSVYCDESLKRFETVFPAAGTSNSAVEMTPDELFEISGAKDWVKICDLPTAE